eukprot:2454742-Alexandrium_andersonii.AAC.1
MAGGDSPARLRSPATRADSSGASPSSEPKPPALSAARTQRQASAVLPGTGGAAVGSGAGGADAGRGARQLGQ